MSLDLNTLCKSLSDRKHCRWALQGAEKYTFVGQFIRVADLRVFATRGRQLLTFYLLHLDWSNSKTML